MLLYSYAGIHILRHFWNMYAHCTFCGKITITILFFFLIYSSNIYKYQKICFFSCIDCRIFDFISVSIKTNPTGVSVSGTLKNLSSAQFDVGFFAKFGGRVSFSTPSSELHTNSCLFGQLRGGRIGSKLNQVKY